MKAFDVAEDRAFTERQRLRMAKKLRQEMQEDKAEKFVESLDDLTGSHAVHYVLKLLCEKGNQHTLTSLKELIEAGWRMEE